MQVVAGLLTINVICILFPRYYILSTESASDVPLLADNPTFEGLSAPVLQ